MKVVFPHQYQMIPKQLLRKCGYHEFVDPRTHHISYARTLRAGVLYPRFHVYIEVQETGFQVNLHLDQKKPSYQGSSAHAGEYDGAVVEQEAARIEAIIEHYRFVG